MFDQERSESLPTARISREWPQMDWGPPALHKSSKRAARMGAYIGVKVDQSDDARRDAALTRRIRDALRLDAIGRSHQELVGLHQDAERQQ